MQFVITVDGEAASGKSALSKALAAKLNFIHIDTGKFFRAAAIYLLKKGINLDLVERERNNPDILAEEMKEFDVKILKGRCYLGEEDIDDQLMDERIVKYLPLVGFLPKVREKVYALQRSLALNSCIVFNGRDAGSVVFPNANIKFFITASIEEKAKRRLKDYQQKGLNLSLEEVKESIIKRDKLDIENKNLITPKGAIEIDNSNSFDESLAKMINEVKRYNITIRG